MGKWILSSKINIEAKLFIELRVSEKANEPKQNPLNRMLFAI